MTEENYYPVAARGEEADSESDTSFGEDTWQMLLDTLLWKDALFSLTWLVLILLTALLLIVYRYSLLSLICLLVLVQLILTRIAVKMGPMLSGDFDPDEFVAQRQAFSQDQLFRFSRGMADLIASAILAWNDILETRNAKKVLLASTGLVVSIVLGIAPLEVALTLLALGAFTAVKAYDLQQERIDHLREYVMDRINSSDFVQDRIMPLLTSLLQHLEPVIGRFED